LLTCGSIQLLLRGKPYLLHDAFNYAIFTTTRPRVDLLPPGKLFSRDNILHVFCRRNRTIPRMGESVHLFRIDHRFYHFLRTIVLFGGGVLRLLVGDYFGVVDLGGLALLCFDGAKHEFVVFFVIGCVPLFLRFLRVSLLL